MGAWGRESDIIFSDVDKLNRYWPGSGVVKKSDGGTGEVQGARFKAQDER
jgi:hypothetical protein